MPFAATWMDLEIIILGRVNHDRKVSSVVEGEATYSEEVVWFPKLQNDPMYHYEGIMDAMKTAASKMPRVDAIGVSTAGVVIGNRIMTSSLFLKVKNENPEAFEKVVKNIYTDIHADCKHLQRLCQTLQLQHHRRLPVS